MTFFFFFFGFWVSGLILFCRKEGLDAVLPEGLPVGMEKEFKDSMRTALLVRQSFLDLRDNFRRVVDPPMWSPHGKGAVFAFILLN